MTYAFRILAALAALLFASLAHAQAPITVAPKTVRAGTTPAITITSNGFFDLSRVTVDQIAVQPDTGITGKRVSNASPGSLIFSFDLGGAAPGGPRTLSISANDVTVLLKFAVEAATRVCSPATCTFPNRCVNGVCTRPICSVSNCRPPRRCEDGACVLPDPDEPACRPACRSPTPFCVNGRCQRVPPP